MVGEKWRAMHLETETMLRPFTAALLARAAPLNGKALIDIGCGAGETTILAAKQGANCLGVDISKPLLEVAQNRNDISSKNASFLEVDASNYQSNVNFDIAISRFGIMFFEDPILAFKNIAKVLKIDGKIHFVCWQSATANEWVQLPIAALEGLGSPTHFGDTEAPGPFAFSNPTKITKILQTSGFRDIEIHPEISTMQIGSGRGIDDALDYLTRIGPASRAIADLSSSEKAIAISRLRDLILPKMQTEELLLKGAVWLVSATKI